MHILVLQHEKAEGPGIFTQFLEEDGHSWDTVDLSAGEALPGFDGYDALWVLGGPQNVWQEDEYPWLVEEKAFIREAVAERGMPYLGFCLGHQLLAEALGGKAEEAKTPEIGIHQVQLTEAGATGVLFDGLPEHITCMQWHYAEVTALPPGAQVLATSPSCAVQAMKWETRAYSTQFHAEIDAETIQRWTSIADYAALLDEEMGEGGAEKFKAECMANVKEMNDTAERFYINWLQATSRTR